MGVGAEGEACVIVPQHAGYRLDIHSVLQSQGCEGVTQTVEADVLQPSVPENLFVELHH